LMSVSADELAERLDTIEIRGFESPEQARVVIATAASGLSNGYLIPLGDTTLQFVRRRSPVVALQALPIVAGASAILFSIGLRHHELTANGLAVLIMICTVTIAVTVSIAVLRDPVSTAVTIRQLDNETSVLLRGNLDSTSSRFIRSLRAQVSPT